MAERRDDENRGAPMHKQGGNWTREHERPDSAGSESHEKAKHISEDRARERLDRPHKSQDDERGDRNLGNFREDRERASEAGRKGGQR